MAVHPPLRGRGEALRGLHGRGGHRHRRDQPEGPPVHHRGRRPGGAQRNLRGPGQGLDHDQTVRAGFHGPQRRSRPGASGYLRHEPGVRQGHPRAAAQRGENHRQVPRDQTRQRGRRQGPQTGGPRQRAAQADQVPVVEERIEPDRPAIGNQAQPATATIENRTRLSDARDPPGHLRHQRRSSRGRDGPQASVLVDDALPTRTHERVRPPDTPPLAGHPRLLRPPLHQRDPRRTQQRHPERQDPSPRIQEHGLLQHHDLPDLRQTRPQHRHHLTDPPTPNSERPSLILPA